MTTPTLRAHTVHTLDDRVRILKDLVFKGPMAFDKRASPVGSIRDPRMRQIGLFIVQNCPPRADMCELKAIFDFMTDPRNKIRYTGDIAGYDTYQSAIKTLLYFNGGDCLPLSTKVLRSDYKLVAIAELSPGDRIMADGVWVQVQDVWATGEKTILASELTNGCALPTSPEHRVFLADGTEIRAEALRPGNALLAPTTVFPCGEAQSWPGISDNDFAWLQGVYTADGWWDKSRICISGRDGKPKEAQKRRVQSIMESAGIDTRWHERYIAINDRALADHFSAFGHHAPVKHLPALGIAQSQLDSLIEGLCADSGTTEKGTIVHSTTSAEMALQLRVLYRMKGQSVHIRRVDEHGGLGTNPIYRVTVRMAAEDYSRPRANVRSAPQIKSITERPPELCGDLTVEGGRFWLPEADVMVHNCDDHSVANAVLAMVNGYATKFRITSNTGSSWDHIYTMAGVPKHNPKHWVALDTTLGQGKFNIEPGRAKFRDFTVGDI